MQNIHIAIANIIFTFPVKTIYFPNNEEPLYNNNVYIIQPICVFICTPPDTHLYGAIIKIDITVSLKIPRIYAIIKIIIPFGSSPIIFCNPYIITSALSSSTSGISFLIFLVKYAQNLSIILFSFLCLLFSFVHIQFTIIYLICFIFFTKSVF